MHCYYHQSVDAVAMCKNCHRGLCPECAAEVPNGVACRNRCEAEAVALDRVTQRNKTRSAEVHSLQARSILVMVPVGIGFLVAVLYAYATVQRYARAADSAEPPR